MTEQEPQMIYVILILPTLFGLTLVGEGLNKVLKNEKMGWTSIIFGLLFTLAVIFVFLFFFQNFTE